MCVYGFIWTSARRLILRALATDQLFLDKVDFEKIKKVLTGIFNRHFMSLFNIVWRILDLHLNALQEGKIQYFFIGLAHGIFLFFLMLGLFTFGITKKHWWTLQKLNVAHSLIKNGPHVASNDPWITLCLQMYHNNLVLWKTGDDASEKDIVPKTMCSWWSSRTVQNSGLILSQRRSSAETGKVCYHQRMLGKSTTKVMHNHTVGQLALALPALV